MSLRTSFTVTISAPDKTITFVAKFVEIESTNGHIVILPNHAPVAFQMSENSKIFLEQACGGHLVLDIGRANAVFGRNGTLIVVKNIF